MLAMLLAFFGGNVETVPVATAYDLLHEGAVLVDVREPHEWAAGRASGAINVPLGEIRARGAAALDARGIRQADGTKLLLICRSGVRSRTAARILATDGGFTSGNVAGGTQAWARARLPMEGPQ